MRSIIQIKRNLHIKQRRHLAVINNLRMVFTHVLFGSTATEYTYYKAYLCVTIVKNIN